MHFSLRHGPRIIPCLIIVGMAAAYLFCVPAALAQRTASKPSGRSMARAVPFVNFSRTPSTPPAEMTRAEYSHDGIKRTYALFSPPSTGSSPGPRPLLVLLHGCGQDAESFARATRMNEVAVRENAYVLYPEQSADANPARCWSWFNNENQLTENGADERNWLSALTQSLARSLGTDQSRTFIAVLSIGPTTKSSKARKGLYAYKLESYDTESKNTPARPLMIKKLGHSGRGGRLVSETVWELFSSLH